MIANSTRTAGEITRTVGAEVERERSKLGSVPLACLSLAQRYGVAPNKVESLYERDRARAFREALRS